MLVTLRRGLLASPADDYYESAVVIGRDEDSRMARRNGLVA
jgi:hypothetical protein